MRRNRVTRVYHYHGMYTNSDHHVPAVLVHLQHPPILSILLATTMVGRHTLGLLSLGAIAIHALPVMYSGSHHNYELEPLRDLYTEGTEDFDDSDAWPCLVVRARNKKGPKQEKRKRQEKKSQMSEAEIIAFAARKAEYDRKRRSRKTSGDQQVPEAQAGQSTSEEFHSPGSSGQGMHKNPPSGASETSRSFGPTRSNAALMRPRNAPGAQVGDQQPLGAQAGERFHSSGSIPSSGQVTSHPPAWILSSHQSTHGDFPRGPLVDGSYTYGDLRVGNPTKPPDEIPVLRPGSEFRRDEVRARAKVRGQQKPGAQDGQSTSRSLGPSGQGTHENSSSEGRHSDWEKYIDWHNEAQA